LGSVFHSPALGGTLRAIAERGRAGFYEGDVAADIVECLRKLGGKHATDDFFATCSNYVTPIRSEFNGIDVCEIPPNGQGITALIMLNILKRLPMREADAVSADRYHYQLEAQRLAFEARDKFVADPEFAEAPVEYLLSDVFADEMAARISPRRAIESVDRRKGPEYRDTIYLTVVDRDRNACSFINSLYFPFGSAITSPKSGVVLQNRGAGFSLDAKHPNRLEPRKRPLHTIIPGMAMDRGRAAFSFGVMGGDFQPMGHAQVVLNIVEYGMDPQEALDAPRMFAGLGSVAVERGVPAAIVSDLQERGHVIDIAAAPLGGGQIIQIDWVQGALIAGSESRKDGCAMAY
jgi:gamma-glutamyltranspeptidase/glutathione hydrolase